MNDDNGSIKITNSSGFVVQVKKNGIFLGKGSTGLEEILTDMIDAIKGLRVSTSMGPSGTPLPPTQIKLSQLESKLKTILKDGTD